MTRSTVSRRTRRSTAVKFTTAMGRLEIGAPIVCVLLVAQAGALNAQAQPWSTPFAPSSTFGAPIESSAALDPNSARIIANIARDNALYANLVDFATYGGYLVDYGGAALSVSFELDTTATTGSVGPVYEQAGLRWDYDSLPGIPWSRLQVLA
jgi:hypothetical protein